MNRFLRLLKILRVAWRFGLDELVLAGTPLSKLPWPVRVWLWLAKRRRFSHTRGERLRLALESLGPIFVKFGQVLSTRRDLLPDDIANALAYLQDRVKPFPGQIAISEIETALGAPVQQIFEEFLVEPIASASIAQVHFATLWVEKSPGRRELRDVAVKVLRPNMLAVIDEDVALMRLGASLIERISVDGRRLKPKEVVAEFDCYLHDELDLVREAANAAELRRNFEDSTLLLVPEMYWDLCRTNVLVMERMHGIPIGQTEKLLEAGVDLKRLAREGVEIFFTQVFRDGFFHADMHPGNIFVAHTGPRKGSYIALDFGIVGTLSDFDKNYLAQNFLAFFRRDYRRVAELHVESGWVPPETRIESLEASVRTCCEPYFDKPLKEISLGQVLLRLFQTSRRFNVEIQPQLVLLQKTLLNIEGLGRQLDPDLDLWKTAKPLLERWMKEQVGLPAFRNRLQKEAERWAQILPQLPRLTYDALSAKSNPQRDAALIELAKSQRQTQVQMRVLAGMVFVLVVFELGRALKFF